MMMNGGGQQAQSFNVGGSTYQGGNAPQQQSSMPFNYGNSNPYYGVFSSLSQRQQALPQASTALPTQSSLSPQASTSASSAFDQSQNNVAAGLPAAGQQVPSFDINAAANTPAVPDGIPAAADKADASTGRTITKLGMMAGISNMQMLSRLGINETQARQRGYIA